jgi:hypothetical protein
LPSLIRHWRLVGNLMKKMDRRVPKSRFIPIFEQTKMRQFFQQLTCL